MKDIDAAEPKLQPKPECDNLVIMSKHAMDAVIMQKIAENFHTPYENLALGKIDDAIALYKKIIKPLS